MAQRRLISLQDRGISWSRAQLVVPPFGHGSFGVGGDGEERGGEHGQGDVPVPGVVVANLVVVKTGLVLGELEGLLHTPSGPGDPDQLGERHRAAGCGRCSRPARWAW